MFIEQKAIPIIRDRFLGYQLKDFYWARVASHTCTQEHSFSVIAEKPFCRQTENNNRVRRSDSKKESNLQIEYLVGLKWSKEVHRQKGKTAPF